MSDVCAVCDEPVVDEPHYDEADRTFHGACCPHPGCRPPPCPKTPDTLAMTRGVPLPPNESQPCKCRSPQEHRECDARCLDHPKFLAHWPPPHDDAPGSDAWWAALAVHWPALKTVEMPGAPRRAE